LGVPEDGVVLGGSWAPQSAAFFDLIWPVASVVQVRARSAWCCAGSERWRPVRPEAEGDMRRTGQCRPPRTAHPAFPVRFAVPAGAGAGQAFCRWGMEDGAPDLVVVCETSVVCGVAGKQQGVWMRSSARCW